MKAISLWQPWGSLWLSPAKEHETRHWTAIHRGALLVHAAKKIVTDVDGPLSEILYREFGAHWRTDLPRGAIIGVVNLVAIVPTRTLPAAHSDTDDYHCGDFAPGRFAWRRGFYRRFESPIPYRGAQGFFDVPHAVVAEQITGSPAENVGAGIELPLFAHGKTASEQGGSSI